MTDTKKETLLATPIVIKMRREAREELRNSEEGRIADYHAGEYDEYDEDDGDYDSYPYIEDVCERSNTTSIEIRTQEELDDVYFAVCSGTFQRSHFRTACRIADTLRPLVSKGNFTDHGRPLTEVWPGPYDNGRENY